MIGALARRLAARLSLFCWFVGLCPSGGAPGSAPFTPQSIPGLAIWLDANVGCTTTGGSACRNGNVVAGWADRSGNGNSAAACANAPLYAANAVNSRPALFFTSASTECLTTDYSGTAGTIIVVYYTTVTASNEASSAQDLISGDPQAGTTIPAYDLYSDNGTSGVGNIGNYHVRLFSHGTSANASGFSYYAQTSENRFVWNIAGMTDGGGALTSYEQSAATATATIPGGAGEYQATGEMIGASDAGGTPGNYFDGYIAEIIVYSAALSQGQYDEVAAYLENKYNLTPQGSYLLFAANQNGGVYTGNMLHILQGGAGAFLYELPVNYVPAVLSGQTSVVDLAPVPLTDNNGDLVEYNGLYWIEDSRCPYSNGIAYPCYYVDILYSPNLVNWSLAGTLNCDPPSGPLNGTSSSRGCFNDGWFIDPATDDVYALYNASNSQQNFTAGQEYYTPVTLNANGTFSAGTTTEVTGSAFPSGYYTRAFEDIGGTYYTWLTNESTHAMYWASSASPFSGYGAITSTGLTAEWPNWQQSGGNGTLYVNPLPDFAAPTAAYPATDGALGTSAGLGNAFYPTFPAAGAFKFNPQSGIVAKLPAVVMQ
jgi:hypothetical protein